MVQKPSPGPCTLPWSMHERLPHTSSASRRTPVQMSPRALARLTSKDSWPLRRAVSTARRRNRTRREDSAAPSEGHALAGLSLGGSHSAHPLRLRTISCVVEQGPVTANRYRTGGVRAASGRKARLTARGMVWSKAGMLAVEKVACGSKRDRISHPCMASSEPRTSINVRTVIPLDWDDGSESPNPGGGCADGYAVKPPSIVRLTGDETIVRASKVRDHRGDLVGGTVSRQRHELPEHLGKKPPAKGSYPYRPAQAVRMPYRVIGSKRCLSNQECWELLYAPASSMPEGS